VPVGAFAAFVDAGIRSKKRRQRATTRLRHAAQIRMVRQRLVSRPVEARRGCDPANGIDQPVGSRRVRQISRSNADPRQSPTTTSSTIVSHLGRFCPRSSGKDRGLIGRMLSQYSRKTLSAAQTLLSAAGAESVIPMPICLQSELHRPRRADLGSVAAGARRYHRASRPTAEGAQHQLSLHQP
jgi:hypothetical protein